MRHIGIASPRIAWNAIAMIFPLGLSIFAVAMSFGLKAGLVWLIPIPFLVILCVSVTICRNAFCPFIMSANGIRNHLFKVNWEDVANIELVFTERYSSYTSGAKYKLVSICIGEVAYGDLLSQSPKKCIMMPYTQKNVERLRKLAGGMNDVIDNFLSTHIDLDS